MSLNKHANSDYHAMEHKYNFTDVFFRELHITVLANIQDRLTWVNRFSDGDYLVQVPAYPSMTGAEDFLQDSFQDDIVGDARLVEGSQDIVPRAIITFNNWSINLENMTNPNVYTQKHIENTEEVKAIISKTRFIPIKANFGFLLLVESEVDVHKASEAILNIFAMYRLMYFEYDFHRIDCYLTLPDSMAVKINRDKNYTSDNAIQIEFEFAVETLYPAWNKEKLAPKNTQSGIIPMLEGGIENPKRVNWYSQLRSQRTTPNGSNIYDDKIDQTQDLVNVQYDENGKKLFDLYEDPSPDTVPTPNP